VFWVICSAMFMLLMALFSLWAGPMMFRLERRRRGPVAASLVLTALLLWVVGFGSIGLITLRYGHGGPHPGVNVPVSAPLGDHLIWILGFVCLPVSIIMWFAWIAARPPDHARADREDGANE